MSSPHNANGYYTVYGEEALHADHFNARLSFGDTQTVWSRTGYLGFLRRTELTDASGGNEVRKLGLVWRLSYHHHSALVFHCHSVVCLVPQSFSEFA